MYNKIKFVLLLFLLLPACANKSNNNPGMSSSHKRGNNVSRESQFRDMSSDYVHDQSDELSDQNNIPDTVFFAFDSFVINQQGSEVIKRQVEMLQHSGSDVKVEIDGHCDERGTAEYNLALGSKRAESVRKHMVSLGANKDKLMIKTYGKSKPAVIGHNEMTWAKNRRAEVQILN